MTAGPLPLGDPWEPVVTEPAPGGPPAPWEAAVLEPDGMPLPVPPPGAADPTPDERSRALGASAVSAGMKAPAAKSLVVPPERAHLRRFLVRYAQENGLPADLVMALAWAESSWRARVVSSAGAVGVMQLMPATVDFVSLRLLGLGRRLDPRDPVANIRMGTRFLRHLLDANGGDLRRALMAYNQGHASLRRKGAHRAARRFADSVLALRAEFQEP